MIKETDIVAMIDHWLRTPQDSYLGSDYGNALKDILQSPQQSGLANEQIKKMIKDIPILAMFPRNMINIYSVKDGADKVHLIIEFGSKQFNFAE